jgi:[Skp1-protein]-hydroxyproline N-acetylglucosaminyltransferase
MKRKGIHAMPVVIGITLIVVMIIIMVFFIEKNFQEHFGSSCIDFIPEIHNINSEPIKKDTIFISIASYRDRECSLTVDSIYKNARYPKNVFLGICEQNNIEFPEEKCEKSPSEFSDNIRYYNFSYKDAKGPSYARYHCSKLYKNEEYFLQIDSHTMFVKDWDILLITMLNQAKKESNKPVLTAYPPTSEQMSLEGYPEMDNGKFGSNGLPMFLAGFTPNGSPVPTRSPKPFYAAGFFFTYASFLKEVHYDPYLSHLFQGEEELFSARMFTNGYDAFSPNIKVCSHHYARESPLYWNEIENHSECRQKAEKRALFLIGQNDNSVPEEFLRSIHKYGLGTFRTIDDFWKAGGIDFEKKTITNWKSSDDDRYHDDDEVFEGWCFAWDSFKKIKKYP